MRMLRILVLALAAAATVPVPADAHYERGELERLLAPIALYPDSVLSHVLIGATYPDEVAEAARWSRANPRLKGEAAVDAVERQPWDPSVKALVAFPDVLARMDEDPEWTDEVGEAFLDHEADVMDAVQDLRRHAYDAGRLRELDHVHVIYERDYIYLEPRVHHVVYVPYYDPWWAYGTWHWPAYPPYRWRTWGGHAVTYYGSGWHWGIGFTVRPAFYFTTFYWPERYVVVNPRRDRPMYSGRYATQQPREVRHWREQPSASRHASRGDGAWRRQAPAAQTRGPERREERGPDRRDERNAERREPRSSERSADTRPERRDEGTPRQDRTEQRRERMEQGRQRRDAERQQRNDLRQDSRSDLRQQQRTSRDGAAESRAEARQERTVERQERTVERQERAVERQERRPVQREEREHRAAERREERPEQRREDRSVERREERAAPREERGQREERGRGQGREQRARPERRERS